MKIVKKKWGKEVWINNDPDYCMKELHLNKDARCSYHYHKIKKETFYILSGHVKLNIEKDIDNFKPGQYITIEPNTKHSFYGIEDSVILECSSQHFENDSYRLIESVESNTDQ